MNKKLEEDLEKWANFAEAHPDRALDETEALDVTLGLKRQHLLLKLAPHIVQALEQRAKREGKSINWLVEGWLTEKLFIEKLSEKACHVKN